MCVTRNYCLCSHLYLGNTSHGKWITPPDGCPNWRVILLMVARHYYPDSFLLFPVLGSELDQDMHSCACFCCQGCTISVNRATWSPDGTLWSCIFKAFNPFVYSCWTK